jgi:hypothetical protein
MLLLKQSQKFEEEDSINTLASSERNTRLQEMTESEAAIARGITKSQLLHAQSSTQLYLQQELLRPEPVLLDEIPDQDESGLEAEEANHPMPQIQADDLGLDPQLREELEYDYYSELPVVLARTQEHHSIEHVPVSHPERSRSKRKLPLPREPPHQSA